MPITASTRAKRHPPMSDAQYIERWKARCVIDENGCWLWQGFLHHNGYGSASYRGKNGRLHRFMYVAAKGHQIPEGHDVCHSCDVRSCINPAHLWAGTRKENLVDCLKKKRHYYDQVTHCPRGHDFSIHGRLFDTGKGTGKGRACVACNRGRQRMKAGWPEDLAYYLPPGKPGTKLEKRLGVGEGIAP